MGALLGFIIGYVVGAKAGPEGYEEMRKGAKAILESEEVRGLIASGMALFEGFMAQSRGSALAGKLETFTAGNGDIRGALKAISDSGEIQALLASGMSLIGPWLEQGMSMLNERVQARD